MTELSATTTIFERVHNLLCRICSILLRREPRRSNFVYEVYDNELSCMKEDGARTLFLSPEGNVVRSSNKIVCNT